MKFSARFLSASVVLLASATTGVYAADLTTPGTVAEAVASGFYAQIYGGADLAGTIFLHTNNSENLNLGPAFGGAIGWQSGLPGLAIELDALHTNRQVTNSSPDYIQSTSIMVDAKYAFALNDTFDVYAGVGVGALNYFETYNNGSGTFSGWGTGYQAMVGVNAKFTENLSAFAEYRFQDSFSPITVVQDQDQAANSLLLAGLKLSY